VSAARLIGRVGGLAVALGVGAAAFSGSAVAWADGPSDSASHSQHSSAKATASTARARSASPTTAVRARTTKVATPVAAAVAPARTARTTGTPGSLTSAPKAPVAPIDSALDLALLAYARRETAVAVSASATALVMGPSGVPDPSSTYITNVNNLYIQPNSPGAVTQVVFTPEGLYPITGVKSLPLNTSVVQGLEMLGQTAGPLFTAGDPVTIFGYSQSAIISSLYMKQLLELPLPPDNLNFVLVGNEMNPNGGFLSRFPGLKLPSLGLDFYGGTPENAFPTTNYTLEYDGFADFPRYPLNFLADLNAGLGIVFVHTKYAQLTSAQVAGAIPLQTTDPTQKYYIIRTENLPLLEPLRLVPLIGNPLADLVQPALKVLVNLGYGDPKYGWSNVGYANVETPFGFLPKVNVGEAVELFIKGVAQGVSDFVSDFSPGGSFWTELGSIKLPSFGPVTLPTSPGGILNAVKDVTTAVAEAISNAAASLYAALLPTADVINAIVTMLPAYDVTLFLDGIQQAIGGSPIAGLINSIGRPLAADVGLVTTAGLIEVLVLLQAIAGVFGVEVGT
jgi:hypothetical protein